jgi:hypothetical protein
MNARAFIPQNARDRHNAPPARNTRGQALRGKNQARQPAKSGLRVSALPFMAAGWG